MKRATRGFNQSFAAMLMLAIFAMPFAAFAQTQIVYHKNKYSPADDVRIGQEVAGQAERQLRVMRDQEAESYLENLGQRLVANIPREFQHPEFRYYFRVVDDRQINAFALPGGPMYVNTGAILAARDEGELAGVMAHELSHVALRHGTAQATKAQKYNILAAIAGIGGAVVGGPTLGQVAQMPFGVYLLRYSREYETEADLLGARIMARSGYDPRDLANMFRTIESQGGGGGGFLSDHPSPKDRYARINQEAQVLPVANRITDDTDFHRLQEYLRGNRYAMGGQRGSNRYPPTGNYPSTGRGNPSDRPTGRAEYPSSRYRSYSEFEFLHLSVPDNWNEVIEQDSSVWFAPTGAYGTDNNQVVYTHGVNVGTSQARSRSLEQATNEFITALEQNNNNLRSRGGYRQISIGGRTGLTISLSNTNESTGRPEIVTLMTTQLRNGDLLYILTVAPESDYSMYQNVFLNVIRSIQLTD